MLSGASGLLIAGTSSDAGKSLVVTGLCRALARKGIKVAPFKAQNMSNNSMVCADGSEIGRAQYLQATAAGVEPASAMNPVLLKPGSDRQSFVVLRGKPYGTLRAGEYATGRQELAAAAFAAYEELATDYDLVICEGAGSPAEINLRAGDYVNLGLAHRFALPTVVVGDIDRGGVFASLYGTYALLDEADQALLRGFVINKFRGDHSILAPGLSMLAERTGLASLGVLPWLPGVWLDAEDTLTVGAWRAAADGGPATAACQLGSRDRLRVAVIRLPRVSNITDVEALAAEPGVEVLVTTDPEVVAAADLALLPGTRTTVSDLGWLRSAGLADALIARAASRRPILGICGGYQMLATTITDGFESPAGPGEMDAGTVADAGISGLDLLATRVDFGPDKVLGRPETSWRGHPVRGYEIHHGVARRQDSNGAIVSHSGSGGRAVDANANTEPFLDGWQQGQTWGTMWHGTLENDSFRRAWLVEIAAAAGSNWQPAPGAPAFGDRRERMIEVVADAVEANLDLDQLLSWTRLR